MNLDSYTQNVGASSINFLHAGKGEPLAFLHGFGVPPKYYIKLIDALAKQYEVTAPEMYGLNSCNTSAKTIDEYAKLTLELLAALKISPMHLTGHSISGYVTFKMTPELPMVKDIVAMNPLLPVEFGVVGFAWRAVYKDLRELFGMAGGLEGMRFGAGIPLPFLLNELRNPAASIAAIKSVCEADYKGLKVHQPTKILFGTDDEYFRLDESIEEKIRSCFPRVSIDKLVGLNHDWPLFHPAVAADRITSFISSLKVE